MAWQGGKGVEKCLCLCNVYTLILYNAFCHLAIIKIPEHIFTWEVKFWKQITVYKLCKMTVKRKGVVSTKP